MEDDPYEINPETNRLPYFDDLAEPLGYLCFRHAQMEGSINQFIITYWGHGELGRLIISHGGDNLDRRLTFVEQLLHLVEGLPQEYLDDFSEVSTAIKNNILPQRNRLIHDDWAVSGENKMEQRNIKISLKGKPKAFNPIDRNVRERERIWQLTQDCYAAANELSILHGDLWNWLNKGEFHNTFGLYRRGKPRHYRKLTDQAPQSGSSGRAAQPAK